MESKELLVDQLSELISEQWKWAEDSNAFSTKDTLLAFIDHWDNLEISPQTPEARDSLIQIYRLCQKVLAIDMRNPANRKGGLPIAMGLINRKEQNQLRDSVIYQAYDHARYGTGVPERNHEECAELVGLALEKAVGIRLELENIIKIYQRMIELD